MGVSADPAAGVGVLVIRDATTGGVPVTVIGTGVFPEAGVASRLAGGSAVGASDVGEGVGIPGEGVTVGSACSVTQATVSATIAPTKTIALIRFVSLFHMIRGRLFCLCHFDAAGISPGALFKHLHTRITRPAQNFVASLLACSVECSRYSVTPSSRSRFSPCGPRSTPR